MIIATRHSSCDARESERREMMFQRRLQEVRLLFSLAAALGVLACGSGRTPPRAPPVRATAPPPAAQPVYVVRAGDSLSAIAACSGVPVEELARLNRIADPDRLATGARLRLPSGHPCVAPPQRRVVARSSKRQSDPAREARAKAERSLAEATARNDAADFEAALANANACVAQLAPHRHDTRAKKLGARCHVAGGMAAAGLDQRERAIEEFRRALALDPELRLSPDTTSPRILELVSAAQASPSANP
jgi:LysM repeat protein